MGVAMTARLAQFVILVGPRGSGKTTLGHALARSIDSPVYDTDRMVEEVAGESISRLWERGGERRFRDMESRVLQSLEALPRGVVSTGGGIVLDPGNCKILRELGPVFYLHVPVEHLVSRLSSAFEKRPRLKEGLSLSEEVRQVTEERDPIYRSVANHVVETASNSIQGTVEEILRTLRGSEAMVEEKNA